MKKEREIRQILFTAPRVAEYLTVGRRDFSDIAADEVVVRTVRTTVSAGTERANYAGETDVSIFGTPSPFPRAVGYSGAGVVEATGSAVTHVRPGDRVATFWGKHASYNVLPADHVVSIESEAVTFTDAATAFIATFSLAGLRAVGLEMGESVLVMGLGILGRFAVMLARAAGAYPIVACDPNPERRAAALSGGADYALDPLAPGFSEEVRALTDGGARVGVEVTGVGAGLNETLDCMARRGRVSLLGCTRHSDFSVDFYHKVHGPGITLVGANTGSRPAFESYPGHFTHVDDIRTVLRLCGGGRLPLGSLITETASPRDCQAVYTRLCDDPRFPVGLQFDWSGES